MSRLVSLFVVGVLLAGGVLVLRRAASSKRRSVEERQPMPATRRWGFIIGLTALVGLPISALMTLLTANACGMFGDGCDEYGQTGDGFEVALAALGLSVIGVVVGLVLALIPADARDDGTG